MILPPRNYKSIRLKNPDPERRIELEVQGSYVGPVDAGGNMIQFLGTHKRVTRVPRRPVSVVRRLPR
jgi:hypothetical protein